MFVLALIPCENKSLSLILGGQHKAYEIEGVRWVFGLSDLTMQTNSLKFVTLKLTR